MEKVKCKNPRCKRILFTTDIETNGYCYFCDKEFVDNQYNKGDRDEEENGQTEEESNT